MSLRSLERAADDCFTAALHHVQTVEEHRTAIDVWNRILDEASAGADRAKAQLIEHARYSDAAVALTMAMYFRSMKATHEAPFQPAT
jgi:hypothetical protein